MKRLNRLYALFAAAATLTLTSCGALIASDSYGYSPGYYGTGLSTDWYPPLAGAPLVSPVYWGGQIYPGSVLPPMAPTRPGSAATPPGNRPGGNIRPGAASIPSTLPDAIPVPDGGGTSIVPSHPIGNVGGGEPGIVMPPSGSGLRPGRK